MTISHKKLNKKLYKLTILFFLCVSILSPVSSDYFSVAESDTIAESTKFPMARHGHRMVFVPNASEIFMFGGDFGYELGTLLVNSWKYQISNSRWEVIQTSEGPSARMNPGMIYVPDSNSILLYGGMDTAQYLRLNDTWEFDLETDQWRQVESPISPSPRSDSALYYDESTNKAYLFGGYSAAETKLGDTWEFNFQNFTWTQLNITTHPSARYGHHMVYKSQTQEGILFGGKSSGMLNDLWTFNGSSHTWTEMSTENPPTIRYWHNLVYSPLGNSLYVFGGRNDNLVGDSFADTWKYDFDANTWAEISLSSSPSQRMLSYMVMDTIHSNIYLFGGITNYQAASFDDFWKFSTVDSTWKKIDSNAFYFIGAGMAVLVGGSVLGYVLLRKKRKSKI